MTDESTRTSPAAKAAERGAAPAKPDDSAASAPPPWDYGPLWDAYSELFDRDPYFRRFEHPGDEWGSDDFVDHNLDTFVLPYVTPESRVLEIGPGGGRYTAQVLAAARELIGVDASERMVERLQQRFCDQPHAVFLHGDGRTLAGVDDESIDVAYAFNVFVQLRLPDIAGYLVELRRVLRPGGFAALHYAQITGDGGFSYFEANRRAWSREPLQRGAFTPLTLDTMDLLARRYGFLVRRNQIVARDAVCVLQKPGGDTGGPSGEERRRDFTRLEAHLDELAQDVYHEPTTDHHTREARAATEEYLLPLELQSVIELGCGSAPSLDLLAEHGVKTLGVSLGEEPCAHPVHRADMHFTGLPDGAADCVIARHALEHSPMPLLLLMEMRRITRRYALVVVPCDDEIWIEWPNHYSVLSKPLWRRLFDRAGFEILREGEGPLHPDSTEWRFLLERQG